MRGRRLELMGWALTIGIVAALLSLVWFPYTGASGHFNSSGDAVAYAYGVGCAAVVGEPCPNPTQAPPPPTDTPVPPPTDTPVPPPANTPIPPTSVPAPQQQQPNPTLDCQHYTLSMHGNSGPAGGQIELIGAGFIWSGQLRILGLNSPTTPSVQVGPQGNFDTFFTIPSDVKPGTYSLTFAEDVGQQQSVCTYTPIKPFILTVTPKAGATPPPATVTCASPMLLVSPASGPPGSKVNATGTGWIPGGGISIEGFVGFPLPGGPVDGSGSFAFSFPMPDVAQGTYNVTFSEASIGQTDDCSRAASIAVIQFGKITGPEPIPSTKPVLPNWLKNLASRALC